MKLAGKVALITGAYQGLGRSAAETFAREGADVCIVDLKIDDNAEVVQEIKKMGRRVVVANADVSKRKQVDAAVAKCKEAFGRVDILLTMAGITRPAMVYKMTEEQWDIVINVHLKGTYNLIQSVLLQAMMEQRSGSIITVTSSAGLVGTIGQVNYTAAKAGIVGLTKSVAREMAGYNIRANSIAPLARTEMTEKIATDEKLSAKYLDRVLMKRFGDPDEDIAPVMLFLASDDSKYMTGQVLCVDGGLVI